MKLTTLFDAVDGSATATSAEIQMDKRTDWELTILLDSTDGIPRIIIERAYTKGGCTDPPVEADWRAVENCNGDTFFNVTSPPLIIAKKQFTPNYYRIRLEPNTNTTGTVTAILGYKDYP